MSALELLACAVLVSISAFLSGSEIALFSLSRFQLRSFKERFRSTHRKMKRLLGDPGGLLITILVINEVVNIGLSSIVAESVAHAEKPRFLMALPLPAWAIDMALGILLTTPIVLFLCEITPKVVAARANRLIAPLSVGPLTLIYDAFKPVRMVLQIVVSRVSRWTGGAAGGIDGHGGTGAPHGPRDDGDGHPDGGGKKLLREADFLLMLEEGHREGAIQQSELDLIKSVFELDDMTVADVFTPLPQVQTLAEDTTLRSALNTMRSQKFSRIPVTGPDRKQVVGILYSKDLLRAKLEPELMSMTIDAIMRRPLFVSSSMKLNSLFRKFKQQKTHMGVVQGPGGEPVGIITMSDVLEALLEDVLPETEEGAV